MPLDVDFSKLMPIIRATEGEMNRLLSERKSYDESDEPYSTVGSQRLLSLLEKLLPDKIQRLKSRVYKVSEQMSSQVGKKQIKAHETGELGNTDVNKAMELWRMQGEFIDFYTWWYIQQAVSP